MPAALKVKLSLEEDKRLLEISQKEATGKRVKHRAEAIRLSSHGWKVAQIAAYFEWHEQTVREIIQRWKQNGEQGLYDLPKTGRPKQWQEEDLKYLETCLEQDSQVYNSQQLSAKLQQERQVNLSSDRIRKLLKKRVGYGNGREFPTKTNRIKKPKP
ncbi:helix-turn-helix domain-containing protein [Pseudanabaena yagii]|uniref:Helix-turn-helix domain-containing protein n=1 Tax=Pseudanabaena yagii GIHE-NHR1 TaxID=2722753 RepID=A0ABX1LYG5_9CYAN|nr:helix-turn-helix domain-containing protein [Pseudanabaena yagii]NMF61252.1 helix-turn-helix domain-containing protein [Pseudanabaena yagii GIHE-NHR1]